MPKRKKKNNKFVTGIVIGLIIVAAVFDIGLLTYRFYLNTSSSFHDDAKRYKEKSCLVFYPDSNLGFETAKKICENNKGEFDYTITKKGETNLISYTTGDYFYLDNEGNDLYISSLLPDARAFLSDYLRYSMKKEEIDEAYTSRFMEATSSDSIFIDNLNTELKKDGLVIKYSEFNYDLFIPFEDIQQYTGIDFGYENRNYEKKLRYVSDKRPMICFTFDDGPNLKESNPTSVKIAENLDLYDSSATFFLIGSSIYPNCFDYVNRFLKRGMEYGSHTQSHPDLTKLSSEEASREILIPYYDLLNGSNYEMKYFRPPYGARNSDVDYATNLSAILWNVDSLDWDLRRKYEEREAADIVAQRVVKIADDNDVILFHDIYKVSELASLKTMKELIDEGYQIVNVSELLHHLDKENIKVFYGE